MLQNRHLLVAIVSLQIYTQVLAQEVFTTTPIDLDGATSSLEITHTNRYQSGGFSSLWVSPDCSTLLTISDYSQVPPQYLEQPVKRSGWFQANINYNKDGSLQSLSIIDQGQLSDIDGEVIEGAAESIAWYGKGFLVSFDDRGDIYLYPGKSPEGKLLSGNPVVAFQNNNLGKNNRGLESISVLPNGNVFALWERMPKTQIAKGLILRRTKKPVEFHYLANANPGGATTLKDGGILLLERDGFNRKIRLISLSPNFIDGVEHIVEGKVLLEEKTSESTVDNYEGISSCIRDGKEWAFVISDNNGDWSDSFVASKGIKRQRTLLMMINITELSESSNITQ